MRKSVAVVTLVAGSILFLTACSRSLPAEDIERELARQLSSEGFVPDVSCDDDLENEEGATITCTTTLANGDAADILVTAAKVSGDQVEYTWLVQPREGESGGEPTDPATTDESPSSDAPTSEEPTSDQPDPTTTMPTM